MHMYREKGDVHPLGKLCSKSVAVYCTTLNADVQNGYLKWTLLR